jgi:hypothetical protein
VKLNRHQIELTLQALQFLKPALPSSEYGRQRRDEANEFETQLEEELEVLEHSEKKWDEMIAAENVGQWVEDNLEWIEDELERIFK